ncbi:hypothetical protein O9992_07565 [Vibrio lentus]|nr:hypothetical protein [Vibrio lentus]
MSATNRRNVVLRRMLDEQYITQEEYDQARNETLVSKYHGAEIELSAPYVAEVARVLGCRTLRRSCLYIRHEGLHRPSDSKLQKAANQAAIKNLLGHDERHGYRGAEKVLWQN